MLASVIQQIVFSRGFESETINTSPTNAFLELLSFGI